MVSWIAQYVRFSETWLWNQNEKGKAIYVILANKRSYTLNVLLNKLFRFCFPIKGIQVIYA